MKKFTVHCDMGCVRVFTKDTAFFFGNGIGDGTYKVIIAKSRKCLEKASRPVNFISHFEVLSKNSVYLSSYDCSNNIIYTIYTFGIGRWFVNADTDGTIYIIYNDKLVCKNGE